MDEDQYRATYKKLNPNRCIFEKAITNQRSNCSLKRKFVLANRECVACQSKTALKQCTEVLNAIRHNARFSLKVITIEGPMPHNKELQVQAGGMLALQSLLDTTSYKDHEPETVIYIHQTVTNTLQHYASIEKLPFGEIVKDIVKYQSRPKRKKKK